MIGMVANQVMAATPAPKITICHKDAGDPDTTIIVGGKKEAAKHISQHGDHLGACNVCGDGFTDDNETDAGYCDDGNTTGGDGCSATCQEEVCGNGTLDVGEECDDNNTDNGDGCSDTCQTEPICGDGVLNGSEQCDGTDLSGETCSSQGFGGGGSLACDGSCNFFDTSACITEYCGDGVLNGSEQCDGTDLNGETCSSQGFDFGPLFCDGSCNSFDTSSCEIEA